MKASALKIKSLHTPSVRWTYTETVLMPSGHGILQNGLQPDIGFFLSPEVLTSLMRPFFLAISCNISQSYVS